MIMIMKVLNFLITRLELFRFQIRTRKLIKNGLKLGKNVHISLSAWIDDNYPYLIEIGNNCQLCDNVLILHHDGTLSKFTEGCTRLGKVTIGNNCYIGENSTILPGVTIGDNVVVAPNSIVNRNFPSNLYIAGNPARIYRKLDELVQEHRIKMQGERGYTLKKKHKRKKLNKLKKETILELEGMDGYLNDTYSK